MWLTFQIYLFIVSSLTLHPISHIFIKQNSQFSLTFTFILFLLFLVTYLPILAILLSSLPLHPFSTFLYNKTQFLPTVTVILSLSSSLPYTVNLPIFLTFTFITPISLYFPQPYILNFSQFCLRPHEAPKPQPLYCNFQYILPPKFGSFLIHQLHFFFRSSTSAY